MKRSIERLSPHQNGKVLSVLIGAVSAVFVFPLVAYMQFGLSSAERPPMLFLLIALPVAYAVLGYIAVVFGCAVYNVLFRYIGGIEFEENTQ